MVVGVGLILYMGFRDAGHHQAPAPGGIATSTPTTPGYTNYSSDHVGVSFTYPDTYEATSTHQSAGEQKWHTVVLLPKGYVPPQEGESPPAITVSDFANAEGLPLEQFIKNEPKTNFALSADQKLTPATVGGVPALAYRHSGLYETDVVAVESNHKVYVFSAGWINTNDKIRNDFQEMLKTVRFIDHAH